MGGDARGRRHASAAWVRAGREARRVVGHDRLLHRRAEDRHAREARPEERPRLEQADPEARGWVAAAVVVADDEVIKKIQDGWSEFDVAIATPEMMGKVGRLGRVLGPRGLMPNPKTGTVVPAGDLPRVIKESKAGRVEFRVDKTGNLHVPIGKVSFNEQQLYENFAALMHAVMKARPASAKGVYLKKVVLTSTMGPGVKVDANAAAEMEAVG